MPKLNVENPATGKTISLTNPIGLAKMFGGFAVLYILYRLASSAGDKVLGKSSRYTGYGVPEKVDQYAGLNVA